MNTTREKLLKLNAMADMTLEELRKLVFDTIKMAGTPLLSSTCDDIEECLTELEGDSHTFFHFDNLVKLRDSNLLSNDLVEMISNLREKIQVIPTSAWNVKNFKENDAWKDVKCLADTILKNNP